MSLIRNACQQSKSRSLVSAALTLGKLLRVGEDRTLKQMSERSGMPVSILPEIEHDRLTLT